MDGEEQDVMGMGDDVHTPENPYCGEPGCWCHTSVEYHMMVEHPECLAGEVEMAYSFFELYQ